MKIKEIEPYNFEWKNSALHNERETVVRLCGAILNTAVSDWKKIGSKEFVSKKGKEVLYTRSEILEFFNGNFLDRILINIFPDITQEDFCNVIRNQNYKIPYYCVKEIKEKTRKEKKYKKKRRCDRHSDVTGK